ncbi:DNA N-6-adenine-methyltransferase [Bradyrhizobium sp.]|uniref:DNA N-6-adenine-methyltransferase n=1 Tax=Bradyrhizobium sp. TaxID=376 RepID=UPI0039E562B2
MPINAGLFSSETPEWATPQPVFDALNARHGPFLLDVCATQENAKCQRYFTIKENGLCQTWSDNNWMNPPYGRTIGEWIEKAFREALLGRQTVALLPGRTDTRWFHEFIYGRHETQFLCGRLKFGGSKNSAPFPSMVVIFSPGSRRSGSSPKESANSP